MTNRSLTLLAGAMALAIGSTAAADTTLDGTSVGDVFINIVDASQGFSFVYDTGVSQATFNGGGSYSYSLASDPNYQAFVAAEKTGDNIDYSVFSATRPTTSSEIVDFTSSTPVPLTQNSTQMASAATNIASFLVGANFITSTTTNSALLTGTYSFGNALIEGNISGNLLNNSNINAAGGYATDAALGTALALYQDAASRSGVTINAAPFAGTWDVTSAGVATYAGSGSVVPLPAPVVLLLSGLGLMGVVARRTKA